jgi:hypothetical protein
VTDPEELDPVVPGLDGPLGWVELVEPGGGVEPGCAPPVVPDGCAPLGWLTPDAGAVALEPVADVVPVPPVPLGDSGGALLAPPVMEVAPGSPVPPETELGGDWDSVTTLPPVAALLWCIARLCLPGTLLVTTSGGATLTTGRTGCAA